MRIIGKASEVDFGKTLKLLVLVLEERARDLYFSKCISCLFLSFLSPMPGDIRALHLPCPDCV